MKRIIALQPVGEISQEDLVVPASDVAEAFGAAVITAPAMPLPSDAYDHSRDQYLARPIIEALARRKRSEWDRLLGVVSEDLYARGLDAHCVMWFSNTLSETDRKGTRFCPAHQGELADRL